jgi:hypothetical protein
VSIITDSGYNHVFRPVVDGLSFKATAAVLAIAALTFYGALDNYRLVSQDSRAFDDPYKMNLAAARYQPVEAAAPPGVPLGYISDMTFDTPTGLSAFNGARYALAPRLVVHPSAKITPEYWIGNFSRQLDYKALGEPYDLELIKDLGQGVVLYRKRRPA